MSGKMTYLLCSQSFQGKNSSIMLYRCIGWKKSWPIRCMIGFQMNLSLAMQIMRLIILGKTSCSTTLLALSTKRLFWIEKAHLGQDHVFVFKTSFFICAFFLPNIMFTQLLLYHLQRSLTWSGAILVPLARV